MCSSAQPYLGESCKYGDKRSGCTLADCTNDADSCCGTCYTGTTPNFLNVTSKTTVISPVVTTVPPKGMSLALNEQKAGLYRGGMLLIAGNNDKSREERKLKN